MVNGLVYYGVSYAADDLGGSMYMNFNVSTLAAIPAAVAFFYFLNRYALTHLCSLLGGGSKVCHTDLMCHLPSQIFLEYAMR